MILPDINLLLYAYNKQAPQHDKARVWWEETLNGSELVGLPHEVTLGFFHIATNPRLGSSAISSDAAQQTISGWLEAPSIKIILPKTNHTARVFDLLRRCGASGQLTSDASLAIYAIEHRATLYSNDADFSRFPGLDWRNPLTNN